jgi:CRP-like cAMP-binding protein
MTQTDLLEILRSHPFTEGLTEPQLAILAESAELVEIEPEQKIFGSGERSSHFYFLLSGTAFLEFQTPVYTVCIQQLEAGEVFGWSALVDEPYRAFQVRTRAECRVLRIRGEGLLKACEGDNELGSVVFRRLAEVIARRLRAAETRFAEFCGRATDADESRQP